MYPSPLRCCHRVALGTELHSELSVPQSRSTDCCCPLSALPIATLRHAGCIPFTTPPPPSPVVRWRWRWTGVSNEAKTWSTCSLAAWKSLCLVHAKRTSPLHGQLTKGENTKPPLKNPRLMPLCGWTAALLARNSTCSQPATRTCRCPHPYRPRLSRFGGSSSDRQCEW